MVLVLYGTFVLDSGFRKPCVTHEPMCHRPALSGSQVDVLSRDGGCTPSVLSLGHDSSHPRTNSVCVIFWSFLTDSSWCAAVFDVGRRSHRGRRWTRRVTLYLTLAAGGAVPAGHEEDVQELYK